MKYLKTFKIFEKIESYPWRFEKKDDEISIYYFEDDFENQFKVEIERYSENSIEIKYFVKINNEWTYEEVKTNIYKVTETVLGQILNDYLSQNSWVEEIKIVGVGKKVEKDQITLRTKLYLRYLNNNPMSGWELENEENEIYLNRI